MHFYDVFCHLTWRTCGKEAHSSTVKMKNVKMHQVLHLCSTVFAVKSSILAERTNKPCAPFHSRDKHCQGVVKPSLKAESVPEMHHFQKRCLIHFTVTNPHPQQTGFFPSPHPSLKGVDIPVWVLLPIKVPVLNSIASSISIPSPKGQLQLHLLFYQKHHFHPRVQTGAPSASPLPVPALIRVSVPAAVLSSRVSKP